MHDLTGASPVKINKVMTKVMLVVPDDELPINVLYALAGYLGAMTSRFKEPQAALNLVNEIALKAMQDSSALHNSKPEGEIH